MTKRLSSFALPLLFALVAMLLAGCATPLGTVREKAKVPLEGKIVIIPFRANHSYYYDYEGGVTIADAAIADLLTNAAALKPVDNLAVRGLVRSTLLSDEVTPEDWATIGKTADADYLLVGSVDKITWSDPSDPITPRCSFAISFQVIDVASREVVYAGVRSGFYPVMSLGDQGISVYEMGLDGLKRRAYPYIGQCVGRTFHDYNLPSYEQDAVNSSSGLSP